MENKVKLAGGLILLAAVFNASPARAETGDVNFSCMREEVRGIIQVTDRYKEFDIVLRNRCPGDAYWTMCIERMDPWTHKVIESHFPSGLVQADKKSRVNVQMKSTLNAAGDQDRVQEFYVSVGYAIKPPAKASCVAKSCEAKKQEVRKRIKINDNAWQKARTALENRVEVECPDDGWNTKNNENCRVDVRKSATEEMAVYVEKDQLLKVEMAAIDPELCTLSGGDLVNED